MSRYGDRDRYGGGDRYGGSDRYGGGDRYGSGGRDRPSSVTRLYVGHLSSRTRTHDLEDIFSRYGRVRDVDMKRDYAFVEFSDPRDAEDARYSLNGRDVDGSRIIVELSKGGPRAPGSSRDRDFGGRGPPPGSGRCFNCGIDGHWARDCKAGDWKNKCYRCGERGHIERNCQNSPKKLRGRSASPSVSPRRRSLSPRRGRIRSRSFSRSRSYSQSRSPRNDRVAKRADRSVSPRPSRSPKRLRKRTPSPDERSPRGRGSRSPPRSVERPANGSDYDVSPKAKSRSPMDDIDKESPRNGDARSPYESPIKEDARSPYEEYVQDRSPSPVARNGRVVDDDDDDDYQVSPKGSE